MAKKRARPSCRLGDDVISEILLRLSGTSLARCALASDPAFLRSYRSRHRPMLAFFQHPPHYNHRHVLAFAPAVQPTMDGLLLMGINRLLPQQQRPYLFVCDPNTGGWTKIPSPPRDFFVRCGIGFVPDSPASYRIVIFRETLEAVCVFSSQLNKWSVGSVTHADQMLDERLFKRAVARVMCGGSAAPVGGFLYWWKRDEGFVCAYDVERRHLSLVVLPTRMRSDKFCLCFGPAEGQVRYAVMDACAVEVWVLCREDRRLPSWKLERRVGLNDMFGGPSLLHRFLRNCNKSRRFVSEFGVAPIGFDGADRHVVFLMVKQGRVSRVFSCNLLKRDLKEQVYCHCQGGNSYWMVSSFQVHDWTA